ncbi:hypothetical protein ACMFMG_002390 [Clarireedia jacksonii]
MQKSQDEMIDWILRLVKSHGEDGISIERLFERFDGRFNEEIVKSETLRNDVWQHFLIREDVVVLCPASEGAVLKDLEIDDAFALGYGVRKVSVKPDPVGELRGEQNDLTLGDASSVLQDGVDPKSTRRQRKPTTTTRLKSQRKPAGSTKEEASNKHSALVGADGTANHGPDQPATRLVSPTVGDEVEKRQPGKLAAPAMSGVSKELAASTESQSSVSDDVAEQQNALSNHAQHGSQQPPITSRTTSVSAEAAVLEPETQSVPDVEQAEDIPMGDNQSPHTLVVDEVDCGTETPQKYINANSELQISSTEVGTQSSSNLSEKKLQIPASQARQSTARAELSEALPVETPVKKRGRGRPRSTVPKVTNEIGGAENSENGTTLSYSSAAELSGFQTTPTPKKRGRPRGKAKLIDVEAPPELLNEEPPQNGLRSSRRQPKPRQLFDPSKESTLEPHTRLDAGYRSTKIAVFTSYEEMQREHDDEKRKAGASGVYINPVGVTDDRPKKSLVVLMKSDKLRDPSWLESQMGTWIEVLDEKRKVAQAAIEAEAARIASEASPKKRKRNGTVDDGSIKKRIRASKGSGVKQDNTAKESDSSLPTGIISFEFESFSAQPDSSTIRPVSISSSASKTTTPMNNIAFSSRQVSVFNPATSRPNIDPVILAATTPMASHDLADHATQRTTAQNTPMNTNPTMPVHDFPSPSILQSTQPPPLMQSLEGRGAPPDARSYTSPYTTSFSEDTQSYRSPYGSGAPKSTPMPSTQGTYRSPYARQTLDLPEGSVHAAHPLANTSLAEQAPRPATSWPAGFLPPEPLQVQSTFKQPSSWPAGFLPPDVQNPGTNPMSPLQSPKFGRTKIETSTQPYPPSTKSPYATDGGLYNQQEPRGSIEKSHVPSVGRPRDRSATELATPSSPGYAREITDAGVEHHDEAGPVRSTSLQPQVALQLAQGTKSSSPSTVSDKSPRETGSRDATPMSLVESLSSQSNPNTKKRKRSEPKLQSLANISDHSAEKGEIASVSLPAPDDDANFRKAESIDVGEVSGRMSAIYNENFGNLVLSSDRIHLEFWSMAENGGEPVWTIPVLRMAENPIVSMPGSNPMELRLKEKNGDGSVVHHRFQIAKTKPALEKANDMRVKLVSARIFVQMSNAQNSSTQLEDPAEVAARPWKCEKCGLRFKNKEGIKYHLSKSQTTCNPNFKPEDTKPRSVRVPRRKKVKSSIKRKTSKKVEKIDDRDSDSAGGDSDDSIFEWAEQVAGLKEPTKKARSVPAKPAKVYKSLPGERPVLQAIAQSLREEPSVVEALSKIELTKSFEDIALPVSVSTDTKDKCAKSIIKGLLQASKNRLPGDRGLWFAFVTCWLKTYSNSDILPEFKNYAKAVDDLIDDKVMTRATFDFVGQKSRSVSRSILLGVSPRPAAADVESLKESIQTKHPSYYIPSAFVPPQVILAQLETIGKPSTASFETSAEQLDAMLGSEEDEAQQRSSDDEFMPAEGEEDLGKDQMGFMLDSDDDDDASDDSSYPEPEPQSSSNQTRQYQQDLGSVNLSISLSKSKGRSNKGQSNTNELAALSTELLDRSAVLKNAESGAWDTFRKPKRTIIRRDRLPEPITFIQTPTGTWSLRPFGHGVNPIFARPNKETIGNPNLKFYRQSVEEGHRPVVYPNKTVMLPPVQSKHLSQKNSEQTYSEHQSLGSDDEVEEVPFVEPSTRASRYNTRQKKDRILSSYTGLPKPAYRSLTPDPMETISSSVNGVNELDILNHFEPKPLDPEIGRKRNPGINSLPPNPATPGLPHLFSNESAGLWDTLNPFRPATRQKVRVQWPENTAFTLETLPYDGLIEDDELPPSLDDCTKPQKRVVIGIRKSQKSKWVNTRRLTATPDDLVGTHRDVKLAAEELGIQMTNYDTNARRKRQRFKEQGLPADEESRLTMGIVVIRALLGGLEMVIDWVIVGTIFQDYSVNFLRKYWHMLWNKKKSVIEKWTKDFQEAFIIGYRRGHVQSIDYDHIVDYDWNALIDWAMNKINKVGNESKQIDLPGSMEDLDYQYELTPEASNNQWSEQYYYPLAAVYYRMNLVNSVPFTYPLEQNTLPEIDDHMLARSWCRAAAVTPDDMWNSKAATKLLASLPNSVIVNARESLLADKVISKNKRLRTNGRVYNLPDTFNSVFVRVGKIINEQQFREAYLFKYDLDRRIRNGESSFTIPWGVDQGSVMAITNLQAQGRIHVHKSNVPANKFGLTEGGYETRAIDKAKYRFQMDVQPTKDYVFNEDIFGPDWTDIRNPPGIGPRGEIPVWRSMTGELVTGMWKKVLVGITGAFALRSTIDVEGIEKIFRPSMEAWEIRRLVEWGEGKGIWKKCDYARMLGSMDMDTDGFEGWDTEEWWWNIMGRFLVESDG